MEHGNGLLLVQTATNKFYILNQDYVYGHDMATEFKNALAMYKPDAKIVGEDFHELWLKDFAPFLTKVMAAQPQVLFTSIGYPIRITSSSRREAWT